MIDINQIQNPYRDDKVIDACSIFGVMDTSGRGFSGEGVITAIAIMHDRGNGLGGGFAIYGLYPEYADLYALHIMYLSQEGRRQTEAFLNEKFRVVYGEEIPTRPGVLLVHPSSGATFLTLVSTSLKPGQKMTMLSIWSWK